MGKADFLRETIDVIRQIETRFLELGSRLYKIRTEELWNSSYDSYAEFLTEAKLTQGNASMLASVHEHYVVLGGATQEKLAGIGYSSLYQAIPLIEKDGVEKVIEKARLLTRDELKQEVREEKHGACSHPETFVLCSSCHKRV